MCDVVMANSTLIGIGIGIVLSWGIQLIVGAIKGIFYLR